MTRNTIHNHRILLILLVGGFILAMGLILRCWRLSTVPNVITHDEVYYTIQAATIHWFGTDPNGTWRPWSFTPAHPLYAELPGVIFSLGFFLSSNAIFATRFVSVLAGLLVVICLARLTWLLTKNRTWSLSVGFIALFNPWMIQLSRMGFDVLFSLALYLFGCCLLLALSRWWKLIAFAPLVLGFFQYQGLKIILPFVVLGLALFEFSKEYSVQNKLSKSVRSIMPYLVVFLMICSMIVAYAATLHSQAASSRINDLLPLQNDKIASQVNEVRAHSIASPVTHLMRNKLTVLAAMMLEKSMRVYAPERLFIREDTVRNPTAVQHGLFYILDAILATIGALLLFDRRSTRNVGALLMYFALISAIPVAVNGVDTWTYFRAAWFNVTLILLAGIGLGWIIESHRKIAVLVGFLYLILVAQFSYVYFIEYPVSTTMSPAFSQRVLASYVSRLDQQNISVHVHATEPYFTFLEMMAWREVIREEDVKAIITALNQMGTTYQVGNIIVSGSCMPENKNDETHIIDASTHVCNILTDAPDSESVILSPLTTARGFSIYNDSLCREYNRSTYPSISSVTLDIESISNEDFCSSLISRGSL